MQTKDVEAREPSPTKDATAEANPPSSASDTDGGERTTRHQLKKASIAGIPTESNGAPPETAEAEADNASGRLRRKRSADDVDGEEDREASRPEKPSHTRKRSRDDAYERSKAADESIRKTPPSDEAAATATSPKGKRDFKQLDSTDEPDAKRHRDDAPAAGHEEMKETPSSADDSTQATGEGEKPAKIPASSGFANTSTTSPFGNLGDQPSSSSAFAGSAFGKLSGSTQSPFGTLNDSSSNSPFATTTSTSSVFGAPAASKPETSGSTTTADSKSTSPFASVSPPSGGFASLSGAVSSPFGGLGQPSGSSFATPGAKGITGLSSKPAKPFGAPADSDDEEEGSGTEEEEKKEPVVEEEKKDKRFFEQDVETGEEEEETLYNSRAKLYAFVKNEEKKGEWKERGVGSFKVNASEDTNSGKLKARFVMRADGSHRVVLNSPIARNMKIGDREGAQPENGLVLFQGFMDEKWELLQIKMKPDNAKNLWDSVKEIQEGMEKPSEAETPSEAEAEAEAQQEPQP